MTSIVDSRHPRWTFNSRAAICAGACLRLCEMMDDRSVQTHIHRGWWCGPATPASICRRWTANGVWATPNRRDPTSITISLYSSYTYRSFGEECPARLRSTTSLSLTFPPPLFLSQDHTSPEPEASVMLKASKSTHLNHPKFLSQIQAST